MCVIVDTSARGRTFQDDSRRGGAQGAYAFIRDKIKAGEIQMAWWNLPGEGEFDVNDHQCKWLQTYRTMNLVKIYDKSLRDAAVAEVRARAGNSLRSDDEHVLALALVSGARLLVAHDRHLRRDFGNPSIISDPRGKVYPIDEEKPNPTTDVHRTLVAAHAGCCA